LLAVLHSRLARLMSHPGVTAVPTFVVSLFGLYFTGLFDLAMSSHVGHHLMLIHFLLVGLLLFARLDRQAARDGDAALAAYNARLQRLHESSSAR
jgi:cytochrome c oxidase assembly factor CtaG